MIGDDKTCPHCCSIVALEKMVELGRYPNGTVVSLARHAYFIGVIHGAMGVLFSGRPENTPACAECASYAAEISRKLGENFEKLRNHKDGN